MEYLRAGKCHDSKRLDIVLSSHEKIFSRSEAKRLINDGRVKVNGSDDNVAPKRIIRTDDVIEFSAAPPVVSELIPVPYPLEIVYEDKHLLIVDKPTNMVVHPSIGHHSDTLVNYLLHHSKLSNTDATRPGIVHRIDKDTSGLLVVAKDNDTHEKLARQFRLHEISRKYEAIVWGVPDRQKGVIDQPLGRHPVDRKKFAIKSGGKRAVTHWRVLKRFDHLSLLECTLETGRTHQIRVHLSSIGHSLLGDPVYGRFRHYAKKYPQDVVSVLKQSTSQALHAKSLGFLHPQTHEWMEFQSPLPAEMQRVISTLERAADS